MNEEKNPHCGLTSPREENSKFSLKMKRKVTQQTEKSTACQSIYGGSGKTSIKNLLLHTRSRNHQSQNYLHLKYEDIRVNVIHKPKHFLSYVMCTIAPKLEDEGCQCQPKCLWVNRWLSLSNGYPKYQYPIEQVPKSIEEQIKKDLKRTQPESKLFQQQNYQNALYSTLIRYAEIDKEIGYVQGMNMIASVFIYHGKTTVQCVELMKYLMISCNFRQIYLNQFKLAYKCADILIKSLNYRCHDLYKHMVIDKGVNLQIFIVGWLLAMLGNLIPLELMHLVVNHFIEKRWSGLLNIVLTFLIYLKGQLMELEEESEIMERLSINNLKRTVVNWEQLILSSNNVNVIKEEMN